jgi:hypothetical protein
MDCGPLRRKIFRRKNFFPSPSLCDTIRGEKKFSTKFFSAKRVHTFFISICRHLSFSLEHEVDGETLEMMDSIEKITMLFPKLKQQLLFLRQREKLFEVGDDNLVRSIDRSSITATSSSLSSTSIEAITDLSTNDDMNDQILEEAPNKQELNIFFPDDYIIPTLPDAVLQDIQTGALHKFGPHHTNRQVIIDTITYDLINKYNLL